MSPEDQSGATSASVRNAGLSETVGRLRRRQVPAPLEAASPPADSRRLARAERVAPASSPRAQATDGGEAPAGDMTTVIADQRMGESADSAPGSSRGRQRKESSSWPTTTTRLPPALSEEMKTAWLRTARPKQSYQEFLAEALTGHLEHLRRRYNDGQPFAPISLHRRP